MSEQDASQQIGTILYDSALALQALPCTTPHAYSTQAVSPFHSTPQAAWNMLHGSCAVIWYHHSTPQGTATCLNSIGGSCAVIWYHHSTPKAAYSMPEYHGGSCVGLIYIYTCCALTKASPPPRLRRAPSSALTTSGLPLTSTHSKLGTDTHTVVAIETYRALPTCSMPLPTTALRSLHRTIHPQRQQPKTFPTTRTAAATSTPPPSARHGHPIATAWVIGCYMTVSASLIAEVAYVLSKDDVGVKDAKGYEWAKSSGLLMGFYEG